VWLKIRFDGGKMVVGSPSARSRRRNPAFLPKRMRSGKQSHSTLHREVWPSSLTKHVEWSAISRARFAISEGVVGASIVAMPRQIATAWSPALSGIGGASRGIPAGKQPRRV
jgi:hypothetical protein